MPILLKSMFTKYNVERSARDRLYSRGLSNLSVNILFSRR